jgi:hypothetical protein
VDKVEDARRQSAIDQRVDHQPASQPGGIARLEYHRVPGNQRRRHHAERQGDGEVERRDHPEHAVGSHHDAAPLGGRSARHHFAEPVGALHFVAIVADQVDCLLDLADRLQPRFADLDQAGNRHVPFAAFEHVRTRAQNLDPPGPAEIAPRRIGSSSGRNCLVDERSIGLRKFAEDDVAVDWTARGDHFALGAVAAADQCRAGFAE